MKNYLRCKRQDTEKGRGITVIRCSQHRYILCYTDENHKYYVEWYTLGSVLHIPDRRTNEGSLVPSLSSVRFTPKNHGSFGSDLRRSRRNKWRPLLTSYIPEPKLWSSLYSSTMGALTERKTASEKALNDGKRVS